MILSAALTGCGGTGALFQPSEPFLIELSAEVTRAGFDSATSRFECDYTLTATATGGEVGRPGRWAPSTWELTFPDGSRTSTSALTTAVMTQLFGTSRVATGSRHTASASNWAHLPFDVEYTVGYTLDGVTVQTASVTVECF